MSEGDTIWRRDGRNVEDLPDPFGVEQQASGQTGTGQATPPPKRRRYWKYGLYGFAGLLLATLIWLIVTAPLGRALEPLEDPAMLFLTAWPCRCRLSPPEIISLLCSSALARTASLWAKP